jgi:hypothetical protein
MRWIKTGRQTPAMDNVPQDGTLAGELIESTRRDIDRFLDPDDPNREIAGHAALRSLNAAIRVLSNVRHRLLLEMTGTDENPTRLVEGNPTWVKSPGSPAPGL